MSLSRELIVAAKARADAATDGPWEAGDGWVYTGQIYADDNRLSNVLGMPFADPVRADAEHERGRRNAEFIAASREDVPVMADALLRVLDLHAPEPCEEECCGGMLRCLECGRPAPCATVRAVTGDGSSSDSETPGPPRMNDQEVIASGNVPGFNSSDSERRTT